ncbi:hypothetical protein ANN_08095 [Periplaneta americana]|uniref:Uncharacterized protein n=1 Tax=Periplaneta americana TaxID=6978 RepID=A0ABQ8T0H4_PERAM|nr:hypothetical protein ANN_08095 [Periplaneta americana]
MSPESSTESYPAFAHIGLRENPGKNLNQLKSSIITSEELAETYDKLNITCTKTKLCGHEEDEVYELSRLKSIIQCVPKVSIHREYQFKIEMSHNVLNITAFEKSIAYALTLRVCHNYTRNLKMLSAMQGKSCASSPLANRHGSPVTRECLKCGDDRGTLRDIPPGVVNNVYRMLMGNVISLSNIYSEACVRLCQEVDWGPYLQRKKNAN